MNNVGNRGTNPSHPETKAADVVGMVKDKAGEFATKASDYAGQAGQKAQEWASGAAKSAEQAWDATRRNVGEYAAGAAQRAGDWYEDGNEFVRRNPLPALGIAFAMGFCLAQFLSFRSDRNG